MIKCFCDKCGKETTKVTECKKYIDNTKYDLCSDCYEKFRNFYAYTKNVDIEDFMRLTDQEIDLFHYQFKVGDKVITADGLDGVITHVCTCARCKERGFYEPLVKFRNGKVDYITALDKDKGFKSYYSIGDHVFGNLDEESVTNEMNEALEQHKRLVKQLSLIKTLKVEGWSANELLDTF